MKLQPPSCFLEAGTFLYMSLSYFLSCLISIYSRLQHGYAFRWLSHHAFISYSNCAHVCFHQRYVQKLYYGVLVRKYKCWYHNLFFMLVQKFCILCYATINDNFSPRLLFYFSQRIFGKNMKYTWNTYTWLQVHTLYVGNQTKLF